ncbi:MAG: ubiquinone biosynthesis regulatory protein kinase UbiB [Chromatocurvus sp.]
MSRLLRLGRILQVVGRHRLDDIIDADRVPRGVRLLLHLNPFRLGARAEAARAQRLRHALEELGPVFIKFGQMLSTRRDLMPEDIADELARLQDRVPAFPAPQSRKIIEQALGDPVEVLFARFDATPMASASVAQVHAAQLQDGREVVIKVLRPDIEPVIRQDIALLFLLARLAERFLREGWRLRPVALVSDYEQVILDELDLAREAANASQLRRNFADGRLVYVPEVHWAYTRRNVYVMERIHGIPVTDLKTLRQRGTNLKLLAERGVEIFFTQVFRDSFFHADMHPGNIFINADDPADPRYIAIDCAIIGSLSEGDQYYLARNLLGIFQRDYHEVARLHVECGWVPPETRVEDFEAAMRAVCEPIFEKPISEISFGQLLVYLFSTARRFDMEVQPSLILLQKTLLNIEGLGRQLYPQLNLWDTAQPYLENWLRERYSPQQMVKRLQYYLPSWLERLPQVPDALFEQLQSRRQATPARRSSEGAMRRQQQRLAARRQHRQIAGAACAGGALLTIPALQPVLSTLPPAGWFLFALAAALLWPRAQED